MMEPQEIRRDSSESDEGIDKSFYEISPSTGRTKIFNDMVHPHLELPSICCDIINTPQFQRLRNLKQLGLCYYVYPSAGHNRFEHCIGTSYLAGKYAKILKKNQPELDITDNDILCLYIAGLCHDLGHGPFSHTWERFIHEVGDKSYSHERMSLRMLDYMIEDNLRLRHAFDAENLSNQDIVFIKECILGHPLPDNKVFMGRKPCKHFLYQIVSNDRTKIDVDKFDYLLRDCKQLNVATIFDYQRLLDNSRVVGFQDGALCDRIDEDTPTIIVYRKKINGTLDDLFRSRFSMHQKAYQHRVTRVIEEMVLEGLKAAEPHFKVSGSNGSTTYKLTTAWKDPSAFMKLTDSVFELILHWNYGGPEASRIFSNVVKRNLYKFLGCFSGSVEKNILDDLRQKNSRIRLIHTKINFGGGKNKNPLNEVHLFETNAKPTRLFRNKSRDEPEEIRTFVVYDSCDESSEIRVEADVQLQSAKREVEMWATTHNILLEFE